MLKILIAEDDKYLNELLQKNLTSRGYHVIACFDGVQALTAYENEKVDLLITDIMMPNMDGDSLAAKIKAHNPTFPIIMLTALSGIHDKKKSFSIGADDYITKPVDYEELNLRINALMRRYNLTSLKNISHKELSLDYESKLLTINNQPIDLTKKEFMLLYLLLSTPARIYSRVQILDEIWGYETDSLERTVDVHINKLREKLNNTSVEILTVRGLGYKAVLK